MDEHHHEAGPGHQLERLVFFSDAVFAIAITLLVIELHPPHLGGSTDAGDAFRALLALWPEFFGFLVSFLVIGAFWAGHHRTFALAGHWDERLIGPNLLLLLAVAALPFFTGFMSANANARVPALVYAGWLTLAALANMRLQRRVTEAPVVTATADPERIALIRRRGLAVTLGALTALAGCAVSPWPGLGMIGLALIGVWRNVLETRDRRRSARLSAA